MAKKVPNLLSNVPMGFIVFDTPSSDTNQGNYDEQLHLRSPENHFSSRRFHLSPGLLAHASSAYLGECFGQSFTLKRRGKPTFGSSGHRRHFSELE